MFITVHLYFRKSFFFLNLHSPPSAPPSDMSCLSVNKTRREGMCVPLCTACWILVFVHGLNIKVTFCHVLMMWEALKKWKKMVWPEVLYNSDFGIWDFFWFFFFSFVDLAVLLTCIFSGIHLTHNFFLCTVKKKKTITVLSVITTESTSADMNRSYKLLLSV